MTPNSIIYPYANNDLWPRMREEAEEARRREPELAAFLQAFILDHSALSDALAYVLSEELAKAPLSPVQLRQMITECHKADPGISAAAQRDLTAVLERDPAATSLLPPFLFFRGFRALQAYRVAHWLWQADRKIMALYIQSRVAQCYVVDIHPAAVIGSGIMMDHGHGIVIGETAVVENDVSLMHEVTLGGTYKTRGDRHPKIRTGVMLGAGAKVLGNVEIGQGTRVATGSVVVKNVPAHVTVAGVPARIIGSAGSASPAQDMNQIFEDEGSSI